MDSQRSTSFIQHPPQAGVVVYRRATPASCEAAASARSETCASGNQPIGERSYQETSGIVNGTDPVLHVRPGFSFDPSQDLPNLEHLARYCDSTDVPRSMTGKSKPKAKPVPEAVAHKVAVLPLSEPAGRVSRIVTRRPPGLAGLLSLGVPSWRRFPFECIYSWTTRTSI